MNFELQIMQRALALARQGQGAVEPNPMVGAVIARGEHILGEGFHERFGQAHAEVNALAACQKAGHDPAGATLYVTLEPCNHIGKTPPCTEAILAAKLARVVVAMVDPFERVAGRGIERLRQAGVIVDVGLCENEARELNAPFIKRVTQGLPWVILKWAQTLDGRIATAAGDSRWISSPESRRVVHQLRARVDAVMVGIGTVLADDPQLTARDVPVLREALRIVVDPRLRTPLEAKVQSAKCKVQGSKLGNPTPVLSEAKGRIGRALHDQSGSSLRSETGVSGDPRLLLAVREDVLQREHALADAWRAKGAILLGLPPKAHPLLRVDPRMNLRPLLAYLADECQATNVLVEGGATLAGELLAQGLVDQVLVFIAPKLLGDGEAIPAVVGHKRLTIDEALPLTLRDVRQIGGDVMLDYRMADG